MEGIELVDIGQFNRGGANDPDGLGAPRLQALGDNIGRIIELLELLEDAFPGAGLDQGRAGKNAVKGASADAELFDDFVLGDRHEPWD